MATFDKTTSAIQTAWNNGLQVKSWTIDIDDMINNEGLVTLDDIRLMAVPDGQGLVCVAGTVEVVRAATGTTCTVDFGINGGVEFDGATSVKSTAGTIALFDTYAAPVLYSNTSGATTYVTLEPTLDTVTDGGKVTVTMAFFKVGN